MFENIFAGEAEMLLVIAVLPLLIHEPRRRGRIARYGMRRNSGLIIEEETMLESLTAWWEGYRADRKWRRDVRKNRRRHSDLVEQEEWQGTDPVITAQLMLICDRERLREAGVEPDDSRYPDLHDYYYLENPITWWPYVPFMRELRFLLTGKIN